MVEKSGGRGEGEEKQDGSSNFINLRLNRIAGGRRGLSYGFVK